MRIITLFVMFAVSCAPLCKNLHTEVAQMKPQAKCDVAEGCVFSFRFTESGDPYVAGPITPFGGTQRKYHRVSNEVFANWEALAIVAGTLMQKPEFAQSVHDATEETIAKYNRLAKRTEKRCGASVNSETQRRLGQKILERVFAKRGIFRHMRAMQVIESKSSPPPDPKRAG